MDVFPLSEIRKSALAYLDDIVVSSNNVNKQIVHLKHLLALVWDAGSTSKLKNYLFVLEKISHFSHVMRPRWLELSEAETAHVYDLKDSRL